MLISTWPDWLKVSLQIVFWLPVIAVLGVLAARWVWELFN